MQNDVTRECLMSLGCGVTLWCVMSLCDVTLWCVMSFSGVCEVTLGCVRSLSGV